MSEPSLTEFLLARFAEDESRAPHRHVVGCHLHTSNGKWPCDCGLPAYVLAALESKRRIVVDCDELLTKDVEYNEKFGRASLARGFLRILALPYADHPDFREEWKP